MRASSSLTLSVQFSFVATRNLLVKKGLFEAAINESTPAFGTVAFFS